MTSMMIYYITHHTNLRHTSAATDGRASSATGRVASRDISSISTSTSTSISVSISISASISISISIIGLRARVMIIILIMY